MSVLEKVLSRINVTEEGGCWFWEGYTMKSGYGHIRTQTM